MIQNRFLIPDNLYLTEILEKKYQSFHKHLDKFYFVIDYLYERRFLDKRYDNLNSRVKYAKKKLFIPINYSLLRKFIPAASLKKIMDILITEDIIEGDNHYCVGKKSRGFRLKEKYAFTSYTKIDIQDWRLKMKIKENKDYSLYSLSENHQNIKNMILNSFNIDYQNVTQYIDGLKSADLIDEDVRNSYMLQIEKIQNNEFYFSTDNKTGRIFNNYTNLKKELRQFIKHKSEEQLVEIDIANSQPFFLSLLAIQISDEEDVKLFSKLCREGSLYSYINDLSEAEIAKEKILTMFYSPSHWQGKEKQVFEKHFPTILDVIRIIKEDNFKILPIELQKLEAEMMINTVAKILIEKGIDFIPIHDSFLITESNIEKVREIILCEFCKEYGVEPLLREKLITHKALSAA